MCRSHYACFRASLTSFFTSSYEMSAFTSFSELRTIGLATCADNFGNSLAIGHVLARMGAQLILSPSVRVVKADNDPRVLRHAPADSNIEVSRLSDVTVIGVSIVRMVKAGPWWGRPPQLCPPTVPNAFASV